MGPESSRSSFSFARSEDRPRKSRSRVSIAAVALLSLAFACNEPPLYEKRAREILGAGGVDPRVIEALTSRQPLSPEEARELARFDEVAVLHLLGENPGSPVELIEQLSKHPNFEVRTGVAVNPNAPLERLLALRSPGAYSTVNTALARNPKIPQDVLREMERGGESLPSSFAMNPNCPPEIMEKIASSGAEMDRAWLAANPALSDTLIRRLEKDPSAVVRTYLSANPKVIARDGRAVEDRPSTP